MCVSKQVLLSSPTMPARRLDERTTSSRWNERIRVLLMDCRDSESAERNASKADMYESM